MDILIIVRNESESGGRWSGKGAARMTGPTVRREAAARAAAVRDEDYHTTDNEESQESQDGGPSAVVVGGGGGSGVGGGKPFGADGRPSPYKLEQLEFLIQEIQKTGLLPHDLAMPKVDEKKGAFAGNFYMGICRLDGGIHRRIDMRCFELHEEAPALLHCTGSGIFNRLVQRIALNQGMQLSEKGLCKAVKTHGATVYKASTYIPLSTEADIFEQLNLEYREPWQREDKTDIIDKSTGRLAFQNKRSRQEAGGGPALGMGGGGGAEPLALQYRESPKKIARTSGAAGPSSSSSSQRQPFSLSHLQVLVVRTTIRNRPEMNGPDQYGSGSSRWGPPKGHPNPGESYLSAAVREFAEETGLPVPQAALGSAVDLGVGQCNSSGPKTLQLFALEAWDGLSERMATSGGRTLSRQSPPEVDLMEWWPAERAIAPPWQSGMAVQRSAGERPMIGIHPPKARFVKELAQILVQSGAACHDSAHPDSGRWVPAASAVTSPASEHSCGLLVYRFVSPQEESSVGRSVVPSGRGGGGSPGGGGLRRGDPWASGGGGYSGGGSGSGAGSNQEFDNRPQRFGVGGLAGFKLCPGPKGTLYDATRTLDGAVPTALQRVYPLHRDPVTDDVAAKLRRMEAYEIALQGDDYQDKEHQDTNSEALTYAKAAATVMGLPYSLSQLCASKTSALATLRKEPFIGENTAKKIYDLVTTGTCRQLGQLENNQCPTHSDGSLRTLTKCRQRQMLGAHDKLQLKKILGLSAIRAAKIWEGDYNGIGQQVKSIEDMRNLPPQTLELLMKPPSDEPNAAWASVMPPLLQDTTTNQQPTSSSSSSLSPKYSVDDKLLVARSDGSASECTVTAYDASRKRYSVSVDGTQITKTVQESMLTVRPSYSRSSFKFGLNHHEELQEPIPPYEAEEMRGTVLEIVRRQQGCNNCRCACTLRTEFPPGDSRCGGGAMCMSCDDAPDCWHVEFVGGAPRRGRVGHDVDLLVRHATKPSWDGTDENGTVLKPLITELEQRDLLCTKDVWQQPSLRYKKRGVVGGEYAHRKDIHATNETTHGFENLSMDYHDRLFGIWKSKQPDGTIKHRRIDIVVCSFPEELALCRLGWTGSRLFNRLLRHHCLNSGLYLTTHALLVRDAGKPLILKNESTGETVRVPAPGQACPAEVPYQFLQTEEQVMYLLAGCTKKFEKMLDPRNRNL